ncbi:unnamed protein product [Lactuca saligna]|uniref:Uncharacterized protein n=1 Tax=Lactuca saligna TaxID=75948 RepID=A0AA35VHT4_LACSI|nr:unnamed protein product [Lactuca saligna]
MTDYLFFDHLHVISWKKNSRNVAIQSHFTDSEMNDSVMRLKDKKEAEPEADPERDQRTVFAYQMPLKATEYDVYEFFSKAGKFPLVVHDQLIYTSKCSSIDFLVSQHDSIIVGLEM